MASILKPTTPLELDGSSPSVFLAGSIEMGGATNWQRRVERALLDLDAVILNPRRDAWDASWAQTIKHRQFREQVEWELEAQERATFIAMYFAPRTKAPITLLELGLAAHSGKAVVCCPAGFWRRGNVDIVCRRYSVPTVSGLNQLIKYLRRAIRKWHRTISSE